MTLGPRTEVQASQGRLGGSCRAEGAEADMEVGMACGDVRVRGGEQQFCHLCVMGAICAGAEPMYMNLFCI